MKITGWSGHTPLRQEKNQIPKTSATLSLAVQCSFSHHDNIDVPFNLTANTVLVNFVGFYQALYEIWSVKIVQNV